MRASGRRAAGRATTLAVCGGRPIRTKPFPSWPVWGGAEERRLLRVLRSGRWGRLDGREVDTFERRFAAMHGCRHGVAVVNGTVSLRLALIAAGLRAGDEVIVPPYTFFSTASAVVEANMVPVFADIDRDTFNLDPEAAERAISPRSRAIIVVHFAGQPANMPRLLALARAHRLVVIEDAAHAHGARLTDTPVGSMGLAGSFSFQSSKNLTAGEGGIIVTNDDDLAERGRSLHNCGRVPGGVWYEHHTISGNYRLSEFQGAVLNAQLGRLETQADRRDRNGRALSERLRAIPGLFPQKRPATCTRHAYHLFMLRLDATRFGVSRERAIDALRAEGIPCSAGYGFSLPEQPMFRTHAFGPYLPETAHRLDYTSARWPNSDLICREQGVWIGQNVLLGSPRDLDDVARAFEKVHERRADLGKTSR